MQSRLALQKQCSGRTSSKAPLLERQKQTPQKRGVQITGDSDRLAGALFKYAVIDVHQMQRVEFTHRIEGQFDIVTFFS